MKAAWGAASAISPRLTLIGRKNLRPRFGLGFLAHAGPGVGVDRVDSGDCRMRVVQQIDFRAGLPGYLIRLSDDL